MEKQKRRPGRQSDYRPEFVSQVRKLRQIFHARVDEVCRFLGVSYPTVRRWANEHAEFQAALAAKPITPSLDGGPGKHHGPDVLVSRRFFNALLREWPARPTNTA